MIQIDNFYLLIDIFDLLINFGRSFKQKWIKIDQIYLKIDRNYIKIAIVNLIVVLESDLYRNGRPNSLESEFESSTIQIVVSYGLSLVSVLWQIFSNHNWFGFQEPWRSPAKCSSYVCHVHVWRLSSRSGKSQRSFEITEIY